VRRQRKIIFYFVGLVGIFFTMYNSVLSNPRENKMDEFVPKETLFIVPFDEVSTDVLKDIGEALKTQLPLEYHIMPEEPLPAAAFSEERGQYLAPLFLNALLHKYGEKNIRVLGIVDHDLFVPQLNFVFGQADLVNKVAVISLTRLRPEWYGKEKNDEIFKRRTLIEAVHELGHTYGLEHCSKPHCVMYFSNSLADTDRKGFKFCEDCLKKIHKRLAR